MTRFGNSGVAEQRRPYLPSGHRCRTGIAGSASIPFTPFSRLDELGHITDWTCNPVGSATFAAASYDSVFDFTSVNDSLAIGTEDSSFRLVDAKPLPRHPRFGPKSRLPPALPLYAL
ncbi:hypothetical protein ABZP36_011745 [Zizania latifolia]